MARQQVMVHLTAAQGLRCEKPGEHLWPAEKLSVEEISRLLLDHLLWAESERGDPGVGASVSGLSGEVGIRLGAN